MIVKDKFELIQSKTGSVQNVLNLKSFTLKAYEVDKDDLHHLKILVKSYIRSHSGTDIVGPNIDKVRVVRLDSYPLPGFISADGIPYVNLSVLSSVFVSDVTVPDIYCLYTYVVSLYYFVKNKPFKEDLEPHISTFYMSIFMKLFGKKAGLTGTYKDKRQTLNALITLYVLTSMFGNNIDEAMIKKISNRYYIDLNEIDIPKDVNTTIGFIKSLKTNNVIPISENKFSTSIINLSGVTSVPMFEDVSRFLATLMAINIGGNTVFGSFWKKVNKTEYEKILHIGTLYIKRLSD